MKMKHALDPRCFGSSADTGQEQEAHTHAPPFGVGGRGQLLIHFLSGCEELHLEPRTVAWRLRGLCGPLEDLKEDFKEAALAGASPQIFKCLAV